MAAKKKKKGTPQKIPIKKALTWEELLVEKALAMMSETDRQISESAGRFEQKMREKNRQINESAEMYEHRMKESAEQAGVEANEIGEIYELADQEASGGGRQHGRKRRRSSEQGGWETNNAEGHIGGFNRFYEAHGGNIDSPNLIRKFNELGFVFDKSYKDAVINDKKNNISVEIDVTLESDNKVIIIETLTRPTTKDITGHIERMKKVRRYADLHGDKRKYLGAISGLNFNDSEKLFAVKSGFYVIERSGNTYAVTAPEGAYSPREW